MLYKLFFFLLVNTNTDLLSDFGVRTISISIIIIDELYILYKNKSKKFVKFTTLEHKTNQN